MGELADLNESSVNAALADGYRTPDLMTVAGGNKVGTTEMTDAILAKMAAA